MDKKIRVRVRVRVWFRVKVGSRVQVKLKMIIHVQRFFWPPIYFIVFIPFISIFGL